MLTNKLDTPISNKEMSDLREDNKLTLRESIPNLDQGSYTDISYLLKTSLLAEQQVDCLGILKTKSFDQHISTTERNVSKAISLLNAIDAKISIPKDIVLYTVLLIGEHSENENWTSSPIKCGVNQLQKTILDRSSCKYITDILLEYKINYFLAELKPKLLSSTWMKYPAAVVCFTWLLHNFKFPHLGDNIGSILPTCLLLIDDHSNSSKIRGLKCLDHLTRNVSRTDLIQYGRGDVIYSAVEHIIYLRDSDIMPHMSTFLVEFLSKTEHSYTTNSLLWTRFDDVLNIWLPSMEMEQSLVLREMYIDSLMKLLQAMGVSSVRWSDRLLRILSEYTEQEHTLDKALLCLLMFIKAIWPKISSIAHEICFILMKVTIRIYNKEPIIKQSENSKKLIIECLSSLKQLSDKECNRLFNELNGCDELKNFLKLVF